jgi:uncharacterized protein YcbX
MRQEFACAELVKTREPRLRIKRRPRQTIKFVLNFAGGLVPPTALNSLSINLQAKVRPIGSLPALLAAGDKAWMAGSSPAMTSGEVAFYTPNPFCPASSFSDTCGRAPMCWITSAAASAPSRPHVS